MGQGARRSKRSADASRATWTSPALASVLVHAGVVVALVGASRPSALRGVRGDVDRPGRGPIIVDLVTADSRLAPDGAAPLHVGAAARPVARVQGDRLRRRMHAPTTVPVRRHRPAADPLAEASSPTGDPAVPAALVSSTVARWGRDAAHAARQIGLAWSGLRGRSERGAFGAAGAFEQAAPRPPRVPAGEARYLRLDESFPTLPASLRAHGAPPLRAMLEICVDRAGFVREVLVAQSSVDELDRALVQAARSWRYQPRIVDGAPSPFCHLIAFEYTR